MRKLCCLVLCALLLALSLPAVNALAEASEADFAITLTADALTVTAGQKVTLTAAFANPDTVNKKAKNDTITWTLTDREGGKSKAAAIGNNGVVTTQRNVKEKTVVVATATAKAMQSQTASVEITIVPLVSKLTVQADTNTLYLQEGYDTVRLAAQIEPADASGDVVWKSSNEKVAAVDENGVVTALSKGTATVTATAADGSKKTGNVKLMVGVPVGMLDSMEQTGTSGDYLTAGKGSITFSVKEFYDTEGNPVTPTNKNITWSLRVEPESAAQYITIDAKGKLTAAKDCPAASVEVTAAADGSLPAGSATYSTGPVFVAPVSAAEPVKAQSAEDFYGKWSVFMTVDGKGKADNAFAWLMKHNVMRVDFELLELNGRPYATMNIDYRSQGGVDLYLENGALYKDDGSGAGGDKMFELCSDGTMIEYVLTSNLLPDTAIYCVRTDKEKRSIDTGSDEDDSRPEEPIVLLGGLDTTDIYGNAVDGSLIADRKLVMVNVWATYCEPCIGEMEDLGKLNRELEEQGVLIVGVVTDCQNGDLSANESQLKTARSIAESINADYPHLLPSAAMYADFVYAIDAVPTTFFTDGTGRMVGKAYLGAREEAEWREIILRTLSELDQEQAAPAADDDADAVLSEISKQTGGFPDSIGELADRYDLEMMKKLSGLQPAQILDELSANGSCSFTSLGGEWPSGGISWSVGEEDGQIGLSEDNLRVSDSLVTVTLDEDTAKALAESTGCYWYMAYDADLVVHASAYTDPDDNEKKAWSMVVCEQGGTVGAYSYGYDLALRDGLWSVNVYVMNDEGIDLYSWTAQYGADGTLADIEFHF